MAPDRVGDDGRLVFLHIPKTAGTSVRAYVERHFPLEQTLRWYPHRSDRIRRAERALARGRPSPVDVRGKRLFVGHLAFEHWGRVAPGVPVLTMLRDPLARTISNYHQLNRALVIGTRPRTPAMKAASRPLDEWLVAEGSDPTRPTWNRQVRFLATTTPMAGFGGPAGPPTDAGSPRLVALAKQRLAACAFVGSAQRFDDSMLLMAHTFGWRAPRQRIQLNAAPPLRPERTQVSVAAQQALVRMNGADLELHAWAQRRFADRFDALRDELAPRLDGAAARERMRERIDASSDEPDRTRPLRRSVRLGAGGVGFGDGWKDADREPGEAPIRWMGPRADVRLWIDRSQPARVSVVLARAARRTVLQGARLAADGVDIAWSITRHVSTGHRIEATLPADPSRASATTLSFTLPAVAPVGDAPDAPSPRPRGIAVEAIEVNLPRRRRLAQRFMHLAGRARRRVAALRRR